MLVAINPLRVLGGKGGAEPDKCLGWEKVQAVAWHQAGINPGIKLALFGPWITSASKRPYLGQASACSMDNPASASSREHESDTSSSDLFYAEQDPMMMGKASLRKQMKELTIPRFQTTSTCPTSCIQARLVSPPELTPGRGVLARAHPLPLRIEWAVQAMHTCNSLFLSHLTAADR